MIYLFHNSMEADCHEQHENKASGENKKLESFRVALHKTMEIITLAVSEEKFVELYGGLEVFRKKRSAAHKLHNLLKQSLFSSMVNIFDRMIEEENLDDKFALLSNLCEDNILETGSVMWRPPGCVHSHMRTFTISEKLKIMNNLEDYVSRKEAVGERLMEEVNTSRGRLSKIESDLSEILERSEKCSISNESTMAHFMNLYLKLDNVVKCQQL